VEFCEEEWEQSILGGTVSGFRRSNGQFRRCAVHEDYGPSEEGQRALNKLDLQGVGVALELEH
jgi:hypothetical protein